MSLIPGWGSIASAHWWENFYFWAGIVALILLGVTEVVSHRYTERKDELTATEQDETQRRHDEEMARLHLETAKITERAAILEKEAAVARAEQERLKSLVTWRALTAGQLQKLSDDLIASPKEIPHNVTVAYAAGDTEAQYLAILITNTLTKSGWAASLQSRTMASGVFFGIYIPGDNRTVEALRSAFTKPQIPFSSNQMSGGYSTFGGGVFIGGRPVQPDAEIFVGPKLPPF
jgi:hypothetical protein